MSEQKSELWDALSTRQSASIQEFWQAHAWETLTTWAFVRWIGDGDDQILFCLVETSNKCLSFNQVQKLTLVKLGLARFGLSLKPHLSFLQVHRFDVHGHLPWHWDSKVPVVPQHPLTGLKAFVQAIRWRVEVNIHGRYIASNLCSATITPSIFPGWLRLCGQMLTEKSCQHFCLTCACAACAALAVSSGLAIHIDENSIPGHVQDLGQAHWPRFQMESERLHFDDKVQSSKLLTVPRKPVELSSEAKSSNFLPMFPFSSLSVTLEASQHGPKSLPSPLNSLRLLSWTEVNSSCKICEDTLAPSSWQCVLMVFLPHPLALFDKTRSPFEGKGTCLKDLWVQGENWKQKVKVYQKWTLSNTAKCFLAVLCCAYDADSVLLILANWDVDRS